MAELRKVSSLAGVEIKLPNRFAEEFDTTNGYRRYGSDNLYPQQIKDMFRASPTLNKCVTRLAEHLYGEYEEKGLLTSAIVDAVCQDMALFGGFCLHINYNLVGDIDSINYVPFESIRLGEQNPQGLYTYCFYCPDWSGTKTANRKKINPKQDVQRYWMYTDSVETRLRRMEAVGGNENYAGEMLYVSNTISYPTSIESILPLVSMELGIINALYRDVRTNCHQAMIVSIPRGDENAEQFGEQLAQLQGDTNLGKIALYEYASLEEKPEMLNLSSENYDGRFENSKDYIVSKVLGFFKQEAFVKLESGTYGVFSAGKVAEIYSYYNFSIRPLRRKIESALKRIEPTFELPELEYPVPQVELAGNNNGEEIAE